MKNPSAKLKIKVLVFGTFDGLHEGHINLLKQARKYGEYLIAVVGRDSSVVEVKKRSPKHNENERLEIIKRSGLVDEAILGKENHNPYKDPYTLVKEISPDLICLGYDQAEFAEKLTKELKDMNLKTKIKILKPYKPEIYKSSIVNMK